MEIKILSEKDNILQFSIDGIDHVLANTLRRLMLAEVPVLSVDEVEFNKNNSALYDEIISHRIGLIPLTTDLKTYNLKDECKCKGKGCAMCQVLLSLDATGPVTVYSGDLKSKDPKVVPVYDKIPIVKLLKGQKLKLEATAILGKGKEHMKFSPGWFYYQHYPVVKVNNPKNVEEINISCPTKVFEVSDGKLKVKRLESCTLCNQCVDLANPENSISVNAEKNKFIFTMESFGQLPNKEIVSKALEIFDNKLDELEKLVKKAK